MFDRFDGLRSYGVLKTKISYKKIKEACINMHRNQLYSNSYAYHLLVSIKKLVFVVTYHKSVREMPTS